MSAERKTVDVLFDLDELQRFRAYLRDGHRLALAIDRLVARELVIAELIEATAALVDPPLRYSGPSIEIDCQDHATALGLIARARAALAAVRGGSPS